nr:uncharacterized protein LOC109156274 [Ipomoea batatas]
MANSSGNAQYRMGQKRTSEPVEEELISDEESMDQDKANPNCPVIPVTKEEKTHLRCPWRRTLIIRVLRRKVAYSYLLQRLQKMWKPEVSFDLSAINQDYFLVSTNTRVQVVRGYNRGKQITSTRVQHQTDPTGAAHRMDIDFELVGDSPNILAIFANRSDDPDVAIMDDTSQLDHGFLVRRDRLCS